VLLGSELLDELVSAVPSAGSPAIQETVWLSAVGMLAVGATASPLYPIVAAQAYAALPGRSGTVNAAGHLFTPVAMALPWLLGRLADRAGTMAALLVLVAEPLALFLIARFWANRQGPPDGR